jgi:hypothetical protein
VSDTIGTFAKSEKVLDQAVPLAASQREISALTGSGARWPSRARISRRIQTYSALAP